VLQVHAPLQRSVLCSFPVITKVSHLKSLHLLPDRLTVLQAAAPAACLAILLDPRTSFVGAISG
jgi:hypothetical protein